MVPLLWVNGRLAPTCEARLDPRDRGFTLGDGLFETMRAGGGTVPWLDSHLTRLRAGAATIGLPVPWGDDALTRAVTQTLAANRLVDGVVRLTASRGVPAGRGLLPEPQPLPSLVIHAQPFAGYPTELYARGIRVITSRVTRNEHSPLARVKVISALDNVLARREAAARGVDEALLRNTAGHLACASAANLFLVLDRRLVTPCIASGSLPGTTRQFVLAELAPQIGLAVEARVVSPDELPRASEAFLTSALLGVMPLTSVDGRPIGKGVPGPLTAHLRAALADLWPSQIPVVADAER